MVFRVNKWIKLFPLALLLACASKKELAAVKRQNKLHEEKIKQLQSDSAHLSWKIDSLNKYLAEKSLALTQAQKAVTQAQVKEKEKESRKISRARAEAEHYKQISIFLYNITKYVDWSCKTDCGTSFKISIVGNEQLFKDMLEQFNGKTIASRPVEINHLLSTKEISRADIYFISHQKVGMLSDVYKNTKKYRSLVVSDHHHPSNGIHINFFTENDNLKFDLNEEEIKKSNIVMSSTLKSLVR